MDARDRVVMKQGVLIKKAVSARIVKPWRSRRIVLRRLLVWPLPLSLPLSLQLRIRRYVDYVSCLALTCLGLDCLALAL